MGEVYYLQNVKEIQLAEEIFANTLMRIQDRHRNELHVIAKGTYKLRGILKNVTNLHQNDAYLDNYYYHYQLQEEGEKEKLQTFNVSRQNPKETQFSSFIQEENMNDNKCDERATSSIKDQIPLHKYQSDKLNIDIEKNVNI